MRDRLAALEHVVERVTELHRLRRLRVCLLAPARQPGLRRAFFVAHGRIAAVRTLAPGSAGRIEVSSALALSECTAPSLAPEDADELLVVASVLRRPPPELRIVSLDAAEIIAA